MRDEKLPNGCSSQQYADKVNTLMKDHLPHLTSVDLSGIKLSKAIINFMPAACATEGRALARELVGLGTLDDKVEVINRCTEIVAENADQGVEHAVMAASLLPAGPGRQAAMAAAIRPVSAPPAMAVQPAPQQGGKKNDAVLLMLKQHAANNPSVAAALWLSTQASRRTSPINSRRKRIGRCVSFKTGCLTVSGAR